MGGVPVCIEEFVVRSFHCAGTQLRRVLFGVSHMAMAVSNCRWQAPFLSSVSSSPSTSTSHHHLELSLTTGLQSRGLQRLRVSGSGSCRRKRRQQWTVSAELSASSAGQAVDLSDSISARERATSTEGVVETRLTPLCTHLTLLGF